MNGSAASGARNQVGSQVSIHQGGDRTAFDLGLGRRPVDSHYTWSGVMLGRFLRSAVSFLKEESGPTAVEYAVMLAMVLLAVFAAVSNIGGTTSNMYNDLTLQSVGKKVTP